MDGKRAGNQTPLKVHNGNDPKRSVGGSGKNPPSPAARLNAKQSTSRRGVSGLSCDKSTDGGGGTGRKP